MGAAGYRWAREAGRVAAPAALLWLAMLQGGAYAQAAGATAQAGVQPGSGTGTELTLDRVAAMVNGDLILESDLDAEERFTAFQPISDAEVDEQLAMLRKSIPKCAAYHCETEAGWEKFVADQGFTLEEVRDRWRQRMEVLRFIEERFRMGIRISQAEIDEYYKTTMLPAYQKENAPAPPEATIADRIQEILLQQQVDKLLDDWLATLRAQGSVRILKPGEEAP